MRAGRIDIAPGFVFMLFLEALWMGMDMLGCSILAIGAHEGAHILLLSLFGGRMRALQLSWKGARIITEQRGMGYGGELIAVMAGPGINLFLAVLSAGWGEWAYLFFRDKFDAWGLQSPSFSGAGWRTDAPSALSLALEWRRNEGNVKKRKRK